MNPLKHYKCCVASLIDNWGYTLIHHLTKGGHEKKNGEINSTSLFHSEWIR